MFDSLLRVWQECQTHSWCLQRGQILSASPSTLTLWTACTRRLARTSAPVWIRLFYLVLTGPSRTWSPHLKKTTNTTKTRKIRQEIGSKTSNEQVQIHSQISFILILYIITISSYFFYIIIKWLLPCLSHKSKRKKSILRLQNSTPVILYIALYTYKWQCTLFALGGWGGGKTWQP